MVWFPFETIDILIDLDDIMIFHSLFIFQLVYTQQTHEKMTTIHLSR